MQLIDSGKQTAAENMRLDEQLLEELDPYGFPILRFYEFSAPAATYGYFLKPEEHLREGHGLDLARRPTGGGILFHLWDLTFSVLIPAHHEGYSTDVMQNYKYINDRVVEAIGLSCHLLPDEVACSDGIKSPPRGRCR